MNKFAKFPLVLGVVGAICAGALGIVYEITNPVIQRNLKAEAFAKLEVIVPTMTDVVDDKSKMQVAMDEVKLAESDISTVYEIYESSSVVGYGYQVTGSGYGGDMVFLAVLSSTEEKVLGLSCLSHAETNTGSYGGPMLNAPEFYEQFVNLEFDAVSTDVDYVAGSTAKITLLGVLGAVESAIKYHKEVVMNVEIDPIQLNAAEKAVLALPEGQKLVDKTEEFKTKLGNKAEMAVEDMGLLNYAEIHDASDTVVGYAYIVYVDYVIFEGIHQNHKMVFMFDANWENSELVVVSSSDTMTSSDAYVNGPDYDATNPGLMNNKFLQQFNGHKMADLYDAYLNDSLKFDKISGASVTTNEFVGGIVGLIVEYHGKANA